MARPPSRRSSRRRRNSSWPTATTVSTWSGSPRAPESHGRPSTTGSVRRRRSSGRWSATIGRVRRPGRDIAECGPDASAEEVLRGFAQSLQRFATETDQIRFAQLVVTESARLPWIADEFYRLGKGPVVVTFADCLDSLVRRGLLRCPDTHLAARQFTGLVQEFLVWPRVMAFEEEVAGQAPPEVVIEEAVLTFLARYAPAADGPGQSV